MTDVTATITSPDLEADALAIIAASLGPEQFESATNIGPTTGKPLTPSVRRSRPVRAHEAWSRRGIASCDQGGAHLPEVNGGLSGSRHLPLC